MGRSHRHRGILSTETHSPHGKENVTSVKVSEPGTVLCVTVACWQVTDASEAAGWPGHDKSDRDMGKAGVTRGQPWKQPSRSDTRTLAADVLCSKMGP